MGIGTSNISQSRVAFNPTLGDQQNLLQTGILMAYWYKMPSRAFRKSITSRLARTMPANSCNYDGFVVGKGWNNLVRIYEMDY
jgi:hypothetical protein